MSQEEEWRKVPGFPNYEVSNLERWRRMRPKTGYTVARTSVIVPLRRGRVPHTTKLSKLHQQLFGSPAAPTREPRKPHRRCAPSAVDAFSSYLGKVPDSLVGEMAGVSRQAVKMQRDRLGIPAMGLATKTAMARKTLEERIGPRLGKDFDSTIARDLGISATTVGHLRKLRGIPTVPQRRGPGSMGSVITPFKHLLGTMTDGDVAKHAGCTTPSVCVYRQKLGIPAFGRHKE